MFDKRRAIKIYKSMKADLLESIRLSVENENYINIDSAHMVVPSKYATDKVSGYLKKFASKDKFNFYKFSVQYSDNGKLATLYTIDNEKKDKEYYLSIFNQLNKSNKN